MKIAIGILVAAGLAGLAYWLYTRSNSAATTSTSTGSPTSGGILSAVKSAIANRDTTPGGMSPFSKAALTKPSDIVQTHVARKDAVAPYVLQKVGVPAAIAQPVAKVAGYLDVSGYAENYIGKGLGGALNKIGL